MKKLGRPKKDIIKGNKFTLRLSDEDLFMLDYACKKSGKSKSDCIRTGIQMVYNWQKALY